jgi:hypothetical protein
MDLLYRMLHVNKILVYNVNHVNQFNNSKYFNNKNHFEIDSYIIFIA